MLHKASTTATAKNAAETTLMRAEAELVAIENRKKKAELLKDVGEPISLTGKALGMEVDEKAGRVWVAENTAVVRVVDLESGKTIQLYKGHTAPCTSLAFFDDLSHRRVLISGSWDKSIRIWNTTTRTEISITPNAHSDFVKTLLVIPGLRLLVSSGSDRIVRIWDLAKLEDGKPLQSVASITSHTRPVEALALGPSSSPSSTTADSQSCTLFTADTMGVIRAWQLKLDSAQESEGARWKATMLHEMTPHRTGVTEMHFGRGLLWTASLDESAQTQVYPPAHGNTSAKVHPLMEHGVGVRCLLPLPITVLGADEDNDVPFVLTGAGDKIRVWDVSDVHKPQEVVGAGVDGHWHDVTSIRLWTRREGRGVAPWVVSTGLDGVIRKWRLSDLLKTQASRTEEELVRTGCKVKEEKKEDRDGFELTEEEERELAELMGDDD